MPASPNANRLAQLKSLSRLLDDSIPIPGTSYRIGLDPVVDLLPGIGDLLGLVASSYILLAAYRLGIPRVALARMAFNIAIDGIVGAVPVLGPVFDAGWKANTRNVALIEAHLGSARAGRRDAWFFASIIVALVAVAACTAFVAVQAFLWLIHQVNSP